MAMLNRPRPSYGNKPRSDRHEGIGSSGPPTASLDKWLADLCVLLRDANRRFADIAWSAAPGGAEEIWAHKAILYARAGGQFQLRYLSGAAPAPHSRLAGLPANASSTSLVPSLDESVSLRPGAVSAAGASVNSLATTTRQHAVLSGTDPTLFNSILEALYTASGLTDVFSFLFDDHKGGDDPSARVEKLRRDLLYMWRSKLYADCRIMLVSQDGEPRDIEDEDDLEDEAVFSAHRAILCSRSPYFASLLLDPYADSSKRVFSLPSPPFTSASLHFTLGYLYCGTLDFSNRTFDLSTAMQIWRSAQYLGLDLLRAEAEARISQACHAFKDTCSSCVLRVGRVYAFSIAPDVQAEELRAASEKLVVGGFGEVWCKEIGELGYEPQTKLVEAVCRDVDPNTVVDVLRNSKRLKERLDAEKSQWADHLLSMLEPIDARLATVLQKKFPAVVTSRPFQDLLEGVGFSNDVLERLLSVLVATLADETAPETYQVLVGQVMLRDEGLPAATRARVDEARLGIIAYLRSHWLSARSHNGFEPLENWALKELSDELDVSVDDLLVPTTSSLPVTRTGLRPTPGKTPKVVDNGDAGDGSSITASSLRASVLNRNAARQSAAHGHKSQTATPVRASKTLTPSGRLGTVARPVGPKAVDRGKTPVPKLDDSIRRAGSGMAGELAKKSPTSSTSGSSARPSIGTRTPTTSNASRAPSLVASIRSTAKPRPSGGASTADATRLTPRARTQTADSSASVRSAAASAAKTVPRPTGAAAGAVRKAVSTTSVRSTASGNTIGGQSTAPMRRRPMPSIKPSENGGATQGEGIGQPPGSDQTARTASTVAAPTTPKAPARLRTTSASARTLATPKAVTGGKSLGGGKRPGSAASIRSTGSARTAAGSTVKRPGAGKEREKPPPVPAMSPGIGLRSRAGSRASSVAPVRTPLAKRHAQPALPPPAIVEPEADRPKGSARSMRTVKASAPGEAKPLGSALLVGIPCVVSTTDGGGGDDDDDPDGGVGKVHKFRAVVKYLGEAGFGPGQWVGVEVAEREGMPRKRWNDGSVDGVRYFELGQESRESKLRLSRAFTATPSAEGKRLAGAAAGGTSASTEDGSVNSLRAPSMSTGHSTASRASSSRRSDASEASDGPVPTRGLFVRPGEVIFVF